MVHSKYPEGSYVMAPKFLISGTRLRAYEDKFTRLNLSFGLSCPPLQVPLIPCLGLGQLVLGF